MKRPIPWTSAFILASLLLFSLLFLRPTHATHTQTRIDDDVVAYHALAVTEGLPTMSRSGPALWGRLPIRFFGHGPWPYYLAAPFVGLTHSPATLGWVNALYCFLALAANFLFMRRILGSQWWALLSTALLALNPVYFRAAGDVFIDAAYSPLFSIAALFGALEWRRTRKSSRLYAASFALGFGLCVVNRFAFVVAAFAGTALLYSPGAVDRFWEGDKRKALREICIAGAFFALGSFWMFYSTLSNLLTNGGWGWVGSATSDVAGGTRIGYAASFLSRAGYFRRPLWASALLALPIVSILGWLAALVRLRVPPGGVRPEYARLISRLAFFYLLACPFTTTPARSDHVLDFAAIFSWAATLCLVDLTSRLTGLRRFAAAAAVITALAAGGAVAAGSITKPRPEWYSDEKIIADTVQFMLERNILHPRTSDSRPFEVLAAHSRGRIYCHMRPRRSPDLLDADAFIVTVPLNSDGLYQALAEQAKEKRAPLPRLLWRFRLADAHFAIVAK